MIPWLADRVGRAYKVIGSVRVPGLRRPDTRTPDRVASLPGGFSERGHRAGGGGLAPHPPAWNPTVPTSALRQHQAAGDRRWNPPTNPRLPCETNPTPRRLPARVPARSGVATCTRSRHSVRPQPGRIVVKRGTWCVGPGILAAAKCRPVPCPPKPAGPPSPRSPATRSPPSPLPTTSTWAIAA